MARDLEKILIDIRERLGFDFERQRSGVLNVFKWKLADLVYKNSELSDAIDPFIKQLDNGDLHRLIN